MQAERATSILTLTAPHTTNNRDPNSHTPPNCIKRKHPTQSTQPAKQSSLSTFKSITAITDNKKKQNMHCYVNVLSIKKYECLFFSTHNVFAEWVLSFLFCSVMLCFVIVCCCVLNCKQKILLACLFVCPQVLTV